MSKMLTSHLISRSDIDMGCSGLSRKRKYSSSSTSNMSEGLDDADHPQPKLLKLERANTASKISFDDTMEIDRGGRGGVMEPDSSDEDDVRERYRVEIIPTVMGDQAGGSSHNVTGDRRKMFAKSKSVKTCYSMPAPVSYFSFS